MIADGGNNRIIVVNNRKEILWRFPSKEHPAPPGGFYFPDDAYLLKNGDVTVADAQNCRS